MLGTRISFPKMESRPAFVFSSQSFFFFLRNFLQLSNLRFKKVLEKNAVPQKDDNRTRVDNKEEGKN